MILFTVFVSCQLDYFETGCLWMLMPVRLHYLFMSIADVEQTVIDNFDLAVAQ
jgi:hypothetical protein